MSDLTIYVLAVKYKRKLDNAYKQLAEIEDTIDFYKHEFGKDLNSFDIKLMEDIKCIIESDDFTENEKFFDELFEPNENEEDGDIF